MEKVDWKSTFSIVVLIQFHYIWRRAKRHKKIIILFKSQIRTIYIMSDCTESEKAILPVTESPLFPVLENKARRGCQAFQQWRRIVQNMWYVGSVFSSFFTVSASNPVKLWASDLWIVSCCVCYAYLFVTMEAFMLDFDSDIRRYVESSLQWFDGNEMDATDDSEHIWH